MNAPARPLLAPLLLFLTVSGLVVSGSATAAFPATVRGTSPDAALGAEVPVGSGSCLTLAPAAELVTMVSQEYPNSSLLPSESAARQAAPLVWGQLCGSDSFQHTLAAAAAGWFSDQVLEEDKNRSLTGAVVGSLFIEFDLTWNATCPSGVPEYPSGYGCEFDATWSANLTSLTISGPALVVTSLRFAVCDTPYANLSALASVDGFFPSVGTSPTQSVAEQEVQSIWGSICTTATYFDIASTLDVHQVLSFSTWRATPDPNGTLFPTGDLYFEWSLFQGDRACPTPVDGASPDLSCSYWEGWTADLTTDTYSGPTANIAPNLGGAPQPEQGANASAAAGDWTATSLGFVGLGAVVFVAAVVWAADRRRP